MRTAASVLLACSLLLARSALAQDVALFPPTRQDVARGVPVLASATCRDDYVSVNGQSYPCDAGCPFGLTGARENDDLSVLAQVRAEGDCRAAPCLGRKAPLKDEKTKETTGLRSW